jgi:aspartyl-tRNA(Asn)/glutamyl-tRNA(Gln) amidotransferase subunit A
LDGTFPLAPSLDSIGPFANSVGCCAAMDAILAGEPALPLANLPLAGMRLCVPTHYFLDDMDASTERAMDRAVQRLDKAGASVTWRDFSSFDLVQQAQATGSFAVVEAYAVHHERLAAQGGAYDARVASRIMPGAAMGAADYIKLIESRARIKRIFAAEMQPYDALILPTVPIAPPALAEFATDDAYVRLNRLVLRNAAPMNFLDSCAISLPCHEPGAPPAGLMLVGTEMRDQWLLALAQAVEAALAWTPV